MYCNARTQTLALGTFCWRAILTLYSARKCVANFLRAGSSLRDWKFVFLNKKYSQVRVLHFTRSHEQHCLALKNVAALEKKSVLKEALTIKRNYKSIGIHTLLQSVAQVLVLDNEHFKYKQWWHSTAWLSAHRVAISDCFKVRIAGVSFKLIFKV